MAKQGRISTNSKRKQASVVIDMALWWQWGPPPTLTARSKTRKKKSARERGCVCVCPVFQGGPGRKVGGVKRERDEAGDRTLTASRPSVGASDGPDRSSASHRRAGPAGRSGVISSGGGPRTRALMELPEGGRGHDWAIIVRRLTGRVHESRGG